MSINRTIKISKGMWAIRECCQWTVPMFEITDEFIATIIDMEEDVFTVGDHNYVKICDKYNSFRDESYLFTDTKDEMKTVVLRFLYRDRDSLENKIKRVRDDIDEVNNLINAVAGA